MTTSKIWMWGQNQFGQLGDGTTAPRHLPIGIEIEGEVIAVEAGGLSAYALRSDGTVLAWGSNGAGQLGDGTVVDRLRPILIEGLGDVRSIAAGFLSAYALKNDGTVWAWGDGRGYQLGTEHQSYSSEPQRVPGLNNVVAIAAGGGQALALESDGTLCAWGDEIDPYLGGNWDYEVLIRKFNTVVVEYLTRPRDAVYLTKLHEKHGGFLALGAGGSSGYALTGDGKVLAWGSDRQGQLGSGLNLKQIHGYLLMGEVYPLPPVKGIAAGLENAYAVDVDGEVWAWGNNRCLQLGPEVPPLDSWPFPVKVGGLDKIRSVAACGSTVYALRQDGTVWSWGAGKSGGLGDGTLLDRNRPEQIPGLDKINDIASGINSGYALQQID